MPSIYYSKPASLLLTSHCSRVFRISRLLQESSNATSVPAPDAGESNTVTERRASSHFPTDPSSEYPVVFDKKREFPTRPGCSIAPKVRTWPTHRSLFSRSCHSLNSRGIPMFYYFPNNYTWSSAFYLALMAGGRIWAVVGRRGVVECKDADAAGG